MKNNNKVTLSNVTLSGVEVGDEVGVEEQKKIIKNGKELISRKEAILKTGKYAAYTALATFIILNPKKAQAQSVPSDPGW
ncbi:MAG: hypothetical protein L3J45_00820 [Flavobacteriaceae bacterium]|nr:hypothetical protein [Flavobacteriaceae bacterium]